MEKIEVLKKDLINNQDKVNNLFSLIDSINYDYGREENESKVQKTDFFNNIEILKDSVFVECGFKERESGKKHIVLSKKMTIAEQFLQDEETELMAKSQAFEVVYSILIGVLVLGFEDENGNIKMINEFIK